MFNIYLCLGFLLQLVFRVKSDENFILTNVKQIKVREKNYFGYSVLLQTNKSSSRIVVGAPLEYKNIYQCNPTTSQCTPYTILTQSEVAGNIKINSTPFLGATLDGEKNKIGDFVVCAPRVISSAYYVSGMCKRYVNTLALTPFSDLPDIYQDPDTRLFIYRYAFSEAGFSLQFLQNNDIIVGLPGFDSYNGIIGKYDIETLEDKWRKQTHTSIHTNQDKYLGYSVTTANYGETNDLLYIAGEPRGNNLNGQVHIFNLKKNQKSSLTGPEYGSYFGATLLAEDINGDGIDELFVGAPMLAENNYHDVGSVFWYQFDKRRGIFESRFTGVLSGSSTGVSRFGTCMAKLGDIDLDHYSDIAISAPYEDDGIGAVYIFKGSKSGIVLSQRISPKTLTPKFLNTRGFGQGISNGNDIDKNGHNDFIIGAYKTQEIFIVQSKPVIVLSKNITSSVKTLNEHSPQFDVSYCVIYNQRSPIGQLNTLKFNTSLQLDYRLKATDYQYTRVVFNVQENQEKCQKITVIPNLINNIDLSPLKLSLKAELTNDNVIVVPGEHDGNVFIPLSHGCGNDNICEPLLDIKVVPKIQEILLGRDNMLEVEVTVTNTKEPALKCELKIVKSLNVELRSVRECNQDDDIICPISNAFKGEKKFTISFDVRGIGASTPNIKMMFSVNSIARPLPGSNLNVTLTVPVKIQNKPYIEGSTDPENLELKRDSEVLTISQMYTVGNEGPSPVKLDVFIYVPILDGIIIHKETQISNDEGSIQCNYNTNPDSSSVIVTNDNNPKAPENKTIYLNCKEVSCAEIVCSNDFLQASKVSTIVSMYEVKTKELENRFRTKFLTKDLVSFLTAARIGSVTNQAATYIYGYQEKSLPVWIYVVAAVVGLLLLAIVICILYKCHFFNRIYKEKLKEEKLMENVVDESQTPTMRMSDMHDVNNE